MEYVSTLFEYVGAARTGSYALTAANAAIWEEMQLGLQSQPFRVVTPEATERAPFEEDSGSNPGSIVDGETLDVEDDAGSLHGIRCRAPPSLIHSRVKC